uniref:Uncharacterized protein n=1 Tax=Sander lucioperca TaxID=283035 RepID=A0A8C9YKC2_SANLU
MSVTMTKADGITVFTVTSDPQSVYPPLCQILKSLCYSPVCCSVSQHLRRVQRTSQSVLGALHIMVGLLNICLGTILFCSLSGYWYGPLDPPGFPCWLGGLVRKILLHLFFCVIVNVILNLAGVAFAFTGIVLSSIGMATIYMWWMCNNYDDNYYSGYSRQTTTPTPGKDIMREKCLEGKELALMLLRSMYAVLIVLSALELCLAISSAVMAIKALKSSEKGEKEVEFTKITFHC